MKRDEGLLPPAPAPAGRMAPVAAGELYTRCDPAGFDFDTTEGLPEPDGPFAQARAVSR